jgi:colanic acid biosynthesis glycosyl transferase WcaI
MAKVLLHTLVFSPDSVSTAYLMTDLARQLQRLGHSVEVLTTVPHNNLDPEALNRQPMRKRWMGLLYRSDCESIPVWHVKIPMKGNRVFARVLDYAYFHVVSLMVGFFTIGSFDIVIAPSPPLTIGLVGWLLGKRRRVPFVYNIQEIYPDFAINQGLITNPMFTGALRLLERFVYAHSAMLVPISESFARTIRQRNVPDKKLFVIPNFADTELYRPLPRHNPFAEKNNLVHDFVVLYAGNIGLSQDWETFLFAAGTLSRQSIRFVIIGDGVRGKWLEKEIAIRDLQNVSFLGYQSGELMPLVYASSDICTIPMKRATTTDTFPSKTYTILACGKSVIVQADTDSELSRLVEQAQCGRVVAPEDPQAYADAILEAFQVRDDLPSEGARGRAFVQREYSKEAIGQKYDGLIGRLVSS